jgi:hypothetical protein
MAVRGGKKLGDKTLFHLTTSNISSREFRVMARMRRRLTMIINTKYFYV